MAVEDALALTDVFHQVGFKEAAWKRFEQLRKKKVDWTVTTSASIGKICHLGNPLLRTLRNITLKKTPKSITENRFSECIALNLLWISPHHKSASVCRITRSTGDNRWDEKAGLQRDALGSQVIDALEAQEIEETGDEEAYHHDRAADIQQEGRASDHRSGSGRQVEFLLRAG